LQQQQQQHQQEAYRVIKDLITHYEIEKREIANYLLTITSNLQTLSRTKPDGEELKSKFEKQKQDIDSLKTEIKRSREDLVKDVKELESLVKKTKPTAPLEPSEQQRVNQQVEDIKKKRESFLNSIEAQQKLNVLTEQVSSLKRELEGSRAEQRGKKSKTETEQAKGVKRETDAAAPAEEEERSKAKSKPTPEPKAKTKAKAKPSRKPTPSEGDSSKSRSRSQQGAELPASSSSTYPPPPPKPTSRARNTSRTRRPTRRPEEEAEISVPVIERTASVEPGIDRAPIIRTRAKVHIQEPETVNIEQLVKPLPKAATRGRAKSRSRSKDKKASPAVDPENPHGVGITRTIATGSGKPSKTPQNPLPFFDTANDGYYIKL